MATALFTAHEDYWIGFEAGKVAAAKDKANGHYRPHASAAYGTNYTFGFYDGYQEVNPE